MVQTTVSEQILLEARWETDNLETVSIEWVASLSDSPSLKKKASGPIYHTSFKRKGFAVHAVIPKVL
jgi:hypothetical protein